MPDPPVARLMVRRRLVALGGVMLLGATGVVATVGVAQQREATVVSAERGGAPTLSVPASFDGQPATVTMTLVPTGSDTAARPVVSTVDSVGAPNQPDASDGNGSSPVVLAAAQAPAAQAPPAAPAAPAAQPGTAQSLSGRFFAPWGGGAGIAWNDQNSSITGAVGFGRGGSFSWAGDQPATSSSLGADLRLGQSFTLFNQKIFSWGVQGTGDTTDTFKLKGSVAASIPGTKFGFQGSLTLSYDPQNGWQLKFAPLTDRFSLGSEASASITGTLALPGWTPKRLFSQVPGLTGTAHAAQPPTPGAPDATDPNASGPQTPDTTTPDTTTPDTTTPDTTTPDTTTPDTTTPDTTAPDTTTPDSTTPDTTTPSTTVPAVPDTSTPDTTAPVAPAPATPDTQVPATTPDTGTTAPATPVLPAVPDVSSAQPAVPDVPAPVTPVVTDPAPVLPAVTDPAPALPVYTPTVPAVPPPVDVSSDLGNGLGSTGSDLGNGLDSGTDSGVTSDLGNGLGSSDTGGMASLDSGGSFSGGDGGD
jgi:hypothetical protein